MICQLGKGCVTQLDPEGNTPLHILADATQPAKLLLDILYEAGGAAIFSVKNKAGESPVHRLCKRHRGTMGEPLRGFIRHFVSLSASHLEDEDPRGDLPLDISIRSWNTIAVGCLLSSGNVDSEKMTRSGETPFSLAITIPPPPPEEITSLEMLEILYAHNSRLAALRSSDGGGTTPLVAALRSSRRPPPEFLLRLSEAEMLVEDSLQLLRPGSDASSCELRTSLLFSCLIADRADLAKRLLRDLILRFSPFGGAEDTESLRGQLTRHSLLDLAFLRGIIKPKDFYLSVDVVEGLRAEVEILFVTGDANQPWKLSAIDLLDTNGRFAKLVGYARHFNLSIVETFLLTMGEVGTVNPALLNIV